MNKKVYAIPESGISNPIIFNPTICIGCNKCIEICQVDIFIPNPDEKKPPIVLYPGECWYCGCCVVECPKPGAIKLNPLIMNRVYWKRKENSKFHDMVISAQNAMIHVMNLNKEDTVLVISDEFTRSVGEAFYNAAIEYGCTAQLYLLPEKDRPLLEIPTEMNQLVEGKTIVINSFQGFGDETPFRLRWVKKILATESIRVGHGAGITESMMIEGPLNIDYRKMVDVADKLIKRFEDAKKVHVSAPGGTDIVLYIEDRLFSTDVKITKVPYFANLPCGEIWCGPIESKGDGIIVCDGSIGDIGKVKIPLKIVVKKGKILTIESDDQKLVEEVNRLISLDAEARIIGELGIGINPGAKLSGNLLEDEKALQTAHIAFGNNEEMVDGQNKSRTHRDFLFYKPTLTITFKDGSIKTLIRNGDFDL